MNVVSSADTGWDFESDIPGVGSANVTVTNFSGKGVRMIEALHGPITFNNPNVSGSITLTNEAAASAQPVTFNNGNILIKSVYSGTPPAGVWVKGPGNLTFNNVTIGRQALPDPNKKVTGLAWSATDGAKITFNKSPVADPMGVSDSTSKVIQQ